MKKKLLIAGGGTGGHIYCGTSIAEAWQKTFIESEVLFVGAKGRIEETLVPKAGYPLEVLQMGALNGVGTIQKIKSILQLPFAFLKAIIIVLTFKPHAIIGVAGYSSGPVLLAAWWIRLIGKLFGYRYPLAIVEQNAVPGMTNLILGKFVDKIFCAFPGIEKYFKVSKAFFSGNPVRAEMLKFADRELVNKELVNRELANGDLTKNPFTVFVFGGSQGSVILNTLITKVQPLLKDLDIQWIHQTGAKDYERVNSLYQSIPHSHSKRIHVELSAFIYQMKETYDKSSLVICRSGASTLSEIAAVGKPAILVPFAHSADNHQFKNAILFRDAGASLVFEENGNPEDLAKMIRDLVQNPKQLQELSLKSKSLFKVGAAEYIIKKTLEKSS